MLKPCFVFIVGLWHVFVFFFGVVFLFGNDVSLWPNGKVGIFKFIIKDFDSLIYLNSNQNFLYLNQKPLFHIPTH